MAEIKAWQTALITISSVMVAGGGQFALGGDTRKTADESYEMGKACREMLEASRIRETSLFNELRECIRECAHVQSDHVAEMTVDPQMTLEDPHSFPYLWSFWRAP